MNFKWVDKKMRLLSTQEVAQILGVSESGVRLNAQKGRLGFRTVRVGSKWKFPDEEVYLYAYGANWREHVKQLEFQNEVKGNTESCTQQN